jgi:hypothetical protein
MVTFVLLLSTSDAAAQPTLRDAARAADVGQQSNVPAEVRQAEQSVERTVRTYRMGVQGGIGLDPELISFGAHGAFGPFFTPQIDFRPGIDFGIGELTTVFGINLDVLYSLPGAGTARWRPYVGAGPNFALSHVGFDSDDVDEDDDRNRFDFSDTDFEGGMNFIVGARTTNRTFIEMRATAYGVSNIRLLFGFNF